MSNNEHAFLLDNEYYTRTPNFTVTLINAKDNTKMGVAMLGETFDSDPSRGKGPGNKNTQPQGQQGFGNRGIEPLVSIVYFH